MSSALICGSIAYDHIMVFEDRFKNHILPEQVHILNVAFHVPSLRREFGGNEEILAVLENDRIVFRVKAGV